MKKSLCVFFTIAALLMLAVPAFASAPPAQYDLLDLGGEEPAAVYHDPAQSSDAPADGAESTPAPVVDVPVDESTYREEPPAPYEPPVRLPGQGEIDNILSYWEECGYPADVSYAFEAGGEVMEDGAVRAWWEIGLVDADEARKQDILDLVSPACLVEFRTCQFTHAQKQAAYDKLTELAADDPNILEVIFLRNGDTVWVSVPEDVVKEYAEYLIRDLGLGAVVSVTDQHSIASFEGGLEVGIDTPGGHPFSTGNDGALVQTTPQATFPATSTLVPDSPAAQTSPVFWVCLALAVFAACGLTALALRRRFTRLAVTAHGTVRAPGVPLTRKQTERAVKDGAQAPDSALFQAIWEKIKDSSKR